MSEKLSRIGLAIVLALGLGLTACDREDRQDVEQIGNEVEDAGQEVEDAVDEADTDGKDDK